MNTTIGLLSTASVGKWKIDVDDVSIGEKWKYGITLTNSAMTIQFDTDDTEIKPFLMSLVLFLEKGIDGSSYKIEKIFNSIQLYIGIDDSRVRFWIGKNFDEYYPNLFEYTVNENEKKELIAVLKKVANDL